MQKSKAELFRFVASGTGEIELDLYGRKAGRGAYVCRDADCLDAALKGRRLARALRTQGPQEPGALRRQVLEYLL